MIRLVVASLILTTGSHQGAGWAPHMGLPPLPLLASSQRQRILDSSNEFRCVMSWGTIGKRVVVEWTHDASGAFLRQEFMTSYYPTAACRGQGSLDVCIGGKRANGHTVIEVWKLRQPTVLISIPEGQTTLLPNPRVGLRAVYDTSVEGRDMIQSMALQQGGDSLVAVHFYDWKDLYNVSIDISNPSIELIATPSGGTGNVLTVPDLELWLPYVRRKHHPTHGYVLYYSTPTGDGRGVALTDPDKDNYIESFLYLDDTADWVAAEFADPVYLLPLDD